MSTSELLQQVQFVIDAGGNKKAVILEVAVWEELLARLEDLEDLREMEQLQEAGEESIPWEQAKEELRSGGMDV